MLESSPITSWHDTDKYPRISPGAFIHDTAVIIGDVIVEDDVIIYPGAVIRADEGSPIIIGRGTNIQDGVIMHCLKNSAISIGNNCSIAHGAVIHGPCRVGDNCFIGFNSVLLNVEMKNDCFVSHCALVMGVTIENNKFIPPASVIELPEKAANLGNAAVEHKEFAHEVLGVNKELHEGYKIFNKFVKAI